LQGAACRRDFADGVAVRRGRTPAPRDGPDFSARRKRGGACPHGGRRACRQDRAGGQTVTREELYGQAEAYLDALEARGPARLAWAAGASFSENTVALEIGDGLWHTISARRRSYDLKAADPGAGEVSWFGVVEEHEIPAIMALRLRIVGDRVAEAETIV